MTRYSLLNASIIAASVASVGVSNANAATTLKTDQDKVSYVIGYQIGSNFKRDGLEVDLAMLTNGLKEALAGEKSPLTQEETQKLMADLDKNLRAKAEAQRKAAGEKNATEGKNFLTENFRKPGVKKTASGLQYKVVSEGKGDSPKADDTVSVNYKGTLINGTEFDSSYKRGQPATFPLSRVVPCWTEGMQKIKVGGKATLTCPPATAYGDRGAGGVVPPNATLTFEVELLAIEK
jgi:FKBP-type peptidyl-prolyl cis-trans isomerase FklB